MIRGDTGLERMPLEVRMKQGEAYTYDADTWLEHAPDGLVDRI